MTRSTAALLRGYWRRLLPFQGGSTGSNPVGGTGLRPAPEHRRRRPPRGSRRRHGVTRAALTALVIAAGLAIPAAPAYADGPVETAYRVVDVYHGGNSALGIARMEMWIVQWRDQYGVRGTEAHCRIGAIYKVARVQVNRCALGIVGGQALWVNDADINSALQADSHAPNPPTYVSTQHLNNAVPSDWDIVAAGQFTIRWDDGQLSPVQYVNSLQSNDYWCNPSQYPSTDPCSTFIFP